MTAKQEPGLSDCSLSEAFAMALIMRRTGRGVRMVRIVELIQGSMTDDRSERALRDG